MTGIANSWVIIVESESLAFEEDDDGYFIMVIETGEVCNNVEDEDHDKDDGEDDETLVIILSFVWELI